MISNCNLRKKNVFFSILFPIFLSYLFSLDSVRAESQGHVVVAVIDTGIDMNHPKLRPFLWLNEGESGLDKNGQDMSHNQIDDDNNGYVDDVHGWDFVSNSPVLKDSIGHGTHIAGLIVQPKVKIMVLKYYDRHQDGKMVLQRSLQAMKYAINMGAKIINYSGGGNGSSKDEENLIKEANNKGVLLVAAAGNQGETNESKPYFPASYQMDNIISVAAVNSTGELASFSNFGFKSVHIGAQGVNILSTLPGGREGTLSGTSQATAIVSKAVSSLYLQNRELSFDRVKRLLEMTRDFEGKLYKKTKFQGVMNSQRILNVKDHYTDLSGETVLQYPQLKNLFSSANITGGIPERTSNRP
jgi:subtilisin family serine protease